MRFEYVLHRPRTKNITKCNGVSRLSLSIEGVNLFIWLPKKSQGEKVYCLIFPFISDAFPVTRGQLIEFRTEKSNKNTATFVRTEEIAEVRYIFAKTT